MMGLHEGKEILALVREHGGIICMDKYLDPQRLAHSFHRANVIPVAMSQQDSLNLKFLFPDGSQYSLCLIAGVYNQSFFFFCIIAQIAVFLDWRSRYRDDFQARLAHLSPSPVIAAAQGARHAVDILKATQPRHNLRDLARVLHIQSQQHGRGLVAAIRICVHTVDIQLQL